MNATFVDERVATHDPPPKGIPNPIHDDDGADAAGYAGALVAGVRTYGWAAETVIRALGDDWRLSGWVDFSLRRPLFTGDRLVTTVEPAGDCWRLECVGSNDAGDRVVLDGTCGLGEAPWLAELAPPPAAPGQDPPPIRPTYTLDQVPYGQPFRPLTVWVGNDAAARLATDDLGIDHPRYVSADPAAITPYFVAGRMAPLTRHNYTYGPTIHVRSQIQHRTAALADQDVTVGAVIVDAYDRNDHWYQVLDGLVTGSRDGELALIRHHTIFRPRGTTLPEPLRQP
jgi:hypothetical protein